MEQGHRGRRRIDRVTAPDLLDDLEGRSADVVRALRDDCREEEARLSYARRLVQGRLDIARTEIARRSSADGIEGTDALVAQLSQVLADDPAPTNREARTVTFYAPDDAPDRRGTDDAGGAVPLSQLPDLDEANIAEMIATLKAEEERLSLARRTVLHNLDGLQSELVRRYREGAADLDAIMSAALPSRRSEGDAD